MLAFICGFAVSAFIAWILSRPAKRFGLGEIQQFCAREGKAQLDDTARILNQLRLNPDMLKSLLKMGPPDEADA